MAGIAGLATAFGNFVKKGFEAADALGDAAERAGIAVETLSRLKYVAEQNDVEFSALTVSLKRYQVVLSQASTGQKESTKSLALLGLTAGQLKNLRLEDQLRIIADQFQRLKDPADQTRVAVELFGRSGEQLVPLLKQGGSAIEQLTAEADKLGITLDQKTVRSIDKADKALKKLKATLSSLGGRVAGSIAEAFVGPVDNIDAAEQRLEKLIKERQQMISLLGGKVSSDTFEKELARMDARIAGAREGLEIIRKMEADFESGKGVDSLTLPAEGADEIGEVRIRARKKELEGLQKLYRDFDQSTRGALEVARDNLTQTQLKLAELFQAGAISAEKFIARMRDAQTAYEEAVTIEPVEVSVRRVQTGLTRQQEAIKGFVDTVKTGLTNLAMSGEITGKSILKYLLSAFTSKVLTKAIDSIGAALSKALKNSASSNGGGFLAGIISAFSAGGGRTSGPRIVGEEGPEVLLSNGNVMNRRQLAFAMGGGGGNINVEGSTIIVQGATNPAQTAALVEARIQANNKKLVEDMSRRMKDTYGRGLR